MTEKMFSPYPARLKNEISYLKKTAENSRTTAYT
jgi:hypothetical protein